MIRKLLDYPLYRLRLIACRESALATQQEPWCRPLTWDERQNPPEGWEGQSYKYVTIRSVAHDWRFAPEALKTYHLKNSRGEFWGQWIKWSRTVLGPGHKSFVRKAAPGMPWDGPSGGAVDGAGTLWASFWHDFDYELHREGVIGARAHGPVRGGVVCADSGLQEAVDHLYADQLAEAGRHLGHWRFLGLRAWGHHQLLHRFGKKAWMS